MTSALNTLISVFLQGMLLEDKFKGIIGNQHLDSEIGHPQVVFFQVGSLQMEDLPVTQV